MKNAKQILGVVSATFPSFKDSAILKSCNNPLNSVDELACSWMYLAARPSDPGTNGDILPDTFLVSISQVSV